MKTLRIVLLSIVCTLSLSVSAQSDFAIGGIFEKYRKAKGCKMVEMHNADVKGFRLKLYKSLTYKKIGAIVDDALGRDRRVAKKIREVIDQGKVSTGYYMMIPYDGQNRYILFSRIDGASGVLIYIEGKLSPEDIISLIYR